MYEDRLEQQQFPTITSNLKSELASISPSQLFELEGVKIGVIGLATLLTPTTSSGDFEAMKFMDYLETTKKGSAELKA